MGHTGRGSDDLLCMWHLNCAESFPVEVCASGGSTSSPVGQCTLQVFGSELQFVTTSGEVACCCAVKDLNQVAIGAEGEDGVPQVILYSTLLG